MDMDDAKQQATGAAGAAQLERGGGFERSGSVEGAELRDGRRSGDEVAPAGTSRAVADIAAMPDDIEGYYAQSQFEYGLPSLCRMSVPNDLVGKTVVDIGCRRGRGVYKLSSRVGDTGHVVGIEWTPRFVEEARQFMGDAWQRSGLAGNNMEFHLGYPEDLARAGIADDYADLVYINTVSNLAFDPEAAFREMRRILKPGGFVLCEAVLASGERDQDVVRAARAIGNSVQAAPSRADFEEMLARVGFTSVRYGAPEPVRPSDGALREHPVETVETDEDVRFTALVAAMRK